LCLNDLYVMLCVQCMSVDKFHTLQ
jgi:hypothetical protein